MDLIERLKLRTGEEDENLLADLLETAKNAILSRRFPFGEFPEDLEPRYWDLQLRAALDLYNKRGAEGQLAHSDNVASRTYESSWVSESLLREVTPLCRTVS